VSQYRHIYLSPHLDDVALSCGGRIHQLTQVGQPVLVLTIFAGSPRLDGGEEGGVSSDYIASLHQRWETVDDAPAQRRAEDEAAMRILGADFCHLSYPDCVYRQNPVTGDLLYLSDEDIFAQVHLAEFTLAAELRDELEKLIGKPREAILYAPLAAGHHVDHQITAAAALSLRAAGHRVVFYEDYPYAETPATLLSATQWLGGENWRLERFSLRPEDLAAKAEAVLRYRSQLSTFFDGAADVAQRLHAYATSTWQAPQDESASFDVGPCERVWHLTRK